MPIILQTVFLAEFLFKLKMCVNCYDITLRCLIKLYSLSYECYFISLQKETGQEKRQQTLDESFLHMQPARDPFCINRDMLVWFALDLMPFTSVEGEGFRYFFTKNFPKMDIPHRSTLAKKCLTDVYDAVQIE